MEDQRNWTDASYKTYVRPLALPWPYTIAKGERFTQRVSLAVLGRPAAAAARAGGAVTVTLGGETGARVPMLGLAAPAAPIDAAFERTDLLKLAGPTFVMAEFDARKGHDAGLVRRYGELARTLAAELILEAILPCIDAEGRPTDDPAVLRRDLAYLKGEVERAGVQPAKLAVSPACDLKCTLPGGVWPKAPAWAELIGATREAFPGLPIGGGMFSYFTELNRKRPPAELLDFIGHTTCPLVHAGDDLSLTEGLESLPYVFKSTRAFAGGKPYWLFPTAIAMRANPYGAAPAENPSQGRIAMARTDPRERALCGAAWYAGYLAHAARAGLDAVTLATVAGPSGIVHARERSARSWFDEAETSVYPSFHVIRGHAALHGAAVLETAVSAPRDVQALGVRAGDGVELWLVNLTGTPREVRLEGAAPRSGTLALLDEDSFETLCRDPDALPRLGRPTTLDSIALSPYAVAQVTASA